MNKLLTLTLVLCLASTGWAQVKVDPKLPDYVPVSGIAGGNLKTVGSDTMNNMVGLWTEEFKKIYPGVKPEVDGKGSSSALPALTAGQAAFGPMSREPKKAEIADFKTKFGYEPVVLPTSIDMLAVYVNKDNPIEGLSFAEVDAIFSSTRKGGAARRAEKWSDFIKSGSLASQSITCYGRNAASGTYGYFKEVVLGDGDYGQWVNELPGSSAVVQSVGKNLNGIGYSGIGYRTADVKALALSSERGGKPVPPLPENAYSGDYPLSRFLYLAVNYDERNQLDPLRREFLKYVFSKQGQEQVVKDGYLPLSAEMAQEALAAVGIESN
ncbi:MAG: phosphate ABC transporter substrate-binding protein [Pirellulaceae bacterium]